MTRFIAARLVITVPVVFGVTLAVFSMLFLIPGDPVKMMLSEFVTNPEQIVKMRSQLHLDEPFAQQYGRFVWNALHGDLGVSIRDRRPVATEIAEMLPSTLQLALAAFGLAATLGIVLGVVAAVRQNSWWDAGSIVIALLGVSLPSFSGCCSSSRSRCTCSGSQRPAAEESPTWFCPRSRWASEPRRSSPGSPVPACSTS